MIGDNPIVIGIGILMLIFAYIFRGLEGGDGGYIRLENIHKKFKML